MPESSFSSPPWSLSPPLSGMAFCCSWPSPLKQLQGAAAQRVGEELLGEQPFQVVGLQPGYGEVLLAMILLIIFPSSWSPPITHLGGVDRKQSEQRGAPQNTVRWKISRSHCQASIIPLWGSADSFPPLDLPTGPNCLLGQPACFMILGNESVSFIKHYRNIQNIHNMFININL